MSTKSALIAGVLILVCLTVIVLSALATERLAPSVGPIRHPGPIGPFGFHIPLPEGRVGLIGPFGRHMGGAPGIVSAIGSLFFLYLASALAVWAFPRPLREIRNVFLGRPAAWLRVFGIGVLSALAVVLLAALGLFTSAAFPIPFLLPPLLLVAVWVGLVGLLLALGKGIRTRIGWSSASPLLDLAVGSLVVFTLGRIPFVGLILIVLLAAAALGAVVATRMGTGGAWSLAAFDETPRREIS